MTLSQDTHEKVQQMLSGALSEGDILALFEGMNKKSLSIDHLVGGARAMREVMVPLELSGDPIDTCGTGGSGKKTINTSTLVAFLVAAAGGKVAKHGNQSASGNCGCFDVLEALGARIELTPEQEQKIYKELGIVFLFARMHHPAMKHVASARKKFGKKTLFNLLGPLCSPANVRHQLIGTGNAEDARLMAGALSELGAEKAFVVRGEDGLDEVTVCSTTTIISVPESEKSIFDPSAYGVPRAKQEEIEGGSSEKNVEILRCLASGGGNEAQRNLVLINAAHALMLTTLASDFAQAFDLARETLASGEVAKLIDRYIQSTHDIR